MKYVKSGELVRIALLVALLVALIVMRGSCGRAAGHLFHAFEPNAARPGAAATRVVDGGGS